MSVDVETARRLVMRGPNGPGLLLNSAAQLLHQGSRIAYAD